MWVELLELPAELHFVNLITRLGNSLGTFIKAETNIRRNSLRMEKILVLMDAEKDRKESIWIGKIKQPLIYSDLQSPKQSPKVNTEFENIGKEGGEDNILISNKPAGELVPSEKRNRNDGDLGWKLVSKGRKGKDILGTWNSLTPGLVCQIILEPEKVLPMFQKFQMEDEVDPRVLVPAHIPSPEDVKLMNEPLRVLMRWWINDLQKNHSGLVIPWELQLVSDPKPVLPRERKAMSITSEWLLAQSVARTNNVKWFHLV
uniref:DUF4283 domain-containing protein n=1 Tax=Chenopodium quinoa TaxID=63459 RepID=A0A803MTC8_CHEQI